MALRHRGNEPPPIDLRDDERPDEYLYESDDGRSSFVAFLLGGVVITGGLLSFLYYDSNNLQGPDRSGGYLGQLEAPVSSSGPRPPQAAPTPTAPAR